MDDTAFFYSRTLRIIMILAIAVPLVGIGGLLWYFTADDNPDPPALEDSSPMPTESENQDAADVEEPVQQSDDENPLRPVGPKASTRLIPGGSVPPY